MWIAKNNEWDGSHTDLSKYFIEKVKQNVDFEEIISNRHKTTNGYVLIKEIIDVSNLALKREKSINRLISLLNEAKSVLLQSSILNDYILQKHYPDIVKFYADFNVNKLKDNQKNVVDLLDKSTIHHKRLENRYFEDIQKEIKQIDFSSNQFKRNSIIIDKIIDCLIPFLIHKGFSTTSISDISYRYIKKEKGLNSATLILNNFQRKFSKFEFAIKTKVDSIELNTIKKHLTEKGAEFQITDNYDTIAEKFQYNVSSPDSLYLLIKRQTIDPHNYLRNLYETSLKKYVISKNRQDLSSLDDFFDRIYWKFDIESHKFEKSDFNLDPLNVTKRKNTLFQTILTLSKTLNFDFNTDSEIPYIEEIADSLYYYNLALGSKSIENSLSLLWTSLETLLPYRLKDNDISNVQYFVSKTLSIGSIGREITSFANRYNNSNWINSTSLDSLGLFTNYIKYNSSGLKIYFDFLSKVYDTSNDPFDTLNISSKLLCNEFCRLNDIYTGKNNFNINYWIDKIRHSEESITYQLDRIYLHRNQIVHSGKFINEYSNLWNHLEWYVGKLLSYAVVEYLKLENKETFNKKGVFIAFEAYVDNTKNLLELNKEKKITEIDKNIISDLLIPCWQFF